MKNLMQDLTESIVRIDDAYDRYAKSNGMSYSTLMVLYSLYELGPCTQKSIASDSAMPKQTVNTVLSAFMVKGYVTLVPGTTDRRQKLVQLSREGKEFADPIIGRLSRYEQEALDRMTPDEQEQLRRTTRLFAENFDKVINSGSGPNSNSGSGSNSGSAKPSPSGDAGGTCSIAGSTKVADDE